MDVLEFFDTFYGSLREGARRMIGSVERRVDGDTLTLAFQNQLIVKYFQETCAAAFHEQLQANGFGALTVEYAVGPKQEEKKEQITEAEVRCLSKADRRYQNIYPEFAFEEFMEGPTNAMALQACRNLAEGISSHSYRFLLIAGPTASGKTHLIQAIANHITVSNKHHVPKYVDGRSFRDEYVRVANSGNMRDLIAYYHKQYGTVDMLLLDNVRLMTGEKTQKKFAAMMDEIAGRNGMLVVTSLVSTR